MILSVLIVLQSILLPQDLVAVSPGIKDSITVPAESITLRISQNLDSLLNVWYVQNSLKLYDQDMRETYIPDSVNIPRVLSDSIYKERLSCITSAVPLTYNERVREVIDFYILHRKRTVEVMLGLTDYYFPMFEEALDANGVPLEFKYLPVIESALNPRAVSRAGASGIWQFMYTTGKMYDLKVNTFVDDRCDPIKASWAAARHLKDLYNIYHDWTLVIAAYNCGPGNVNKAIKRSNGKTDFWDLYNNLPRETRGYVPAFIAAVYVMNYYKEHNFTPKKIDYPLAVDTIRINKQLHLGQVSEVLGIPVQLLRDINPQYKKDIIPATNDLYLYSIKLPSENVTRFIELQDSIFRYKDTLYFNMKKTVVSANGTIVPENSEKKIHTVKSGESLGTIANKYHVTITNIKNWNDNIHKTVKVGQKLVIYVPSGKSKTSNNKTTVNNPDNKNTGNQVKNNSSINKPVSNGNYQYYTVKSGDNCWSIAKKYGVSNDELMRINNIDDSHGLKIGQKLKIPKGN